MTAKQTNEYIAGSARRTNPYAAVAFGTRAGSVAVRKPRDTGQTVRATTPTVSVVAAEGDLHPVGSDWGSFLAWTRQPAACWFHASNLDGDRFYELAHAAGVLEEEIDRVLDEDLHAKLREGAHHATLILGLRSLMLTREASNAEHF